MRGGVARSAGVGWAEGPGLAGYANALTSAYQSRAPRAKIASNAAIRIAQDARANTPAIAPERRGGRLASRWVRTISAFQTLLSQNMSKTSPMTGIAPNAVSAKMFHAIRRSLPGGTRCRSAE